MKSEIKKLQDKLWNLCKQIIRLQYPNVCYTCNRVNLEGSNLHTGHMWAKASLSAHLKYDLRVLRPQCYHCNINLGGMGADFYTRMLKEKGKKYMDNLSKERNITVKADKFFYQQKIDEYSNILKELNENK